MYRQYEMLEMTFNAPAPEKSDVCVNLTAVFSLQGSEDEYRVKGFYAGDGKYKVRFLPLKAGCWFYRVEGILEAEGALDVKPAAEGSHGPVRAEKTHLKFDDGSWFFSFGTTIYALAHQSKELTEETFASLAKAPFNKVRMCVFPKHYDYNKNDPEFFPFKVLPGETYTYENLPPFGLDLTKKPIWDVHHPDFRFWDSFEEKLVRLQKMGIQVDLILFHPYDRWSFSTLSQEDNLVYLDYLTRRFAAFPHLWWSLANEYDLCAAKTPEDWLEIEKAVAAGDPYHHLLSNHNCFPLYDFSHEDITHCSCQLRTMSMVPELQNKYGKPVLYDECVYEGNLPQTWGSISAAEMVNRFWKVTASGGYCTHGEVFLDPDEKNLDEAVLWWAKGGTLKGQSPERIAYLRALTEEIGAPLNPNLSGFGQLLTLPKEEAMKAMAVLPQGLQKLLEAGLSMDAVNLTRHLDAEFDYFGKTEDENTFLYYYGTDCHALVEINLPEDKKYQIEIIDAWNMTREKVMDGVSGNLKVKLPGREYMAVLAKAI